MKKTIFIHIGAHKTGTSALQLFLSRNREILKENGCLYPGNTIAHHNIVQEFRQHPLEDILSARSNATARCFQEIGESTAQKIILSSENFENLDHQIDTLKGFLLPSFEVKIIMYLRRQDEKIESMYNASVKNPVVRSDKPFSEFLAVFLDHEHGRFQDVSQHRYNFGAIDYYPILALWQEAFGRENILVRCYEKEQLPQGIFLDFLTTVGLGPDDRYWIPKMRINESLRWNLIEVIRSCNAHFRGDREFHQFLIHHLTRINSGYTGGKQRLLSPQQRREIIAMSEESNAKIAREYLNRSDGRLFYAALPDLDEPWIPYEGLTVEKIVPVFSQILFNLDKQQRAHQRTGGRNTINRRLIMAIKTIGLRLGLTPAVKYIHDRLSHSR
jgi:hypothetical protein